jgi:hypothetical protein
MRLRLLAVALLLALLAIPGAGAALAIETPEGSRNFNAPGYVPNYFSNEAGSFQGRASSPSYGAAPAYAAPAPRAGNVFVSGRHGRYRLVLRGRGRGRRYVAAAHGRTARHVAYAAGRSPGGHASVHSRGGTPAASARGRTTGHGGSRRMARR